MLKTADGAHLRHCTNCKKVINVRGPYTKCYQCIQVAKNAECESCDEPFNDNGGKYTRCYRCSAALKNTVCAGGCGVKFDGKGKYTTCFGCNAKARALMKACEEFHDGGCCEEFGFD